MTARIGSAVALALVLALAGCSAPHVGTSSAAPTPTAAPAPPIAPPPVVVCGGPGAVTVRDTAGLTQALAAATPGATIMLAPGIYAGSFTAAASGAAGRPITLCGPREAVLDGGDGQTPGYTLHLDGASSWQLSGFTVRGGQKGVVIDGGQHDVVTGLLIENTGDEGLHLRRASSDNTVSGNEIRSTGHHQAKFGEGVYVGSAQSNWCELSACGPDRSDRNVITGNTISGTTAEAVDIKEGTTGGTLSGNTFSGVGMTAADSWVDIKGNGWTITGNRGTNAPKDGFQVHQILDGWGLDNTFTANSADVDAAGYAIDVTKNRDRNRVACSNTVSQAGKGLSTVACTP